MAKAFVKAVFLLVFLSFAILLWVAFLPYDIVVMIYKTIKARQGLQFMLGYAEGYWEGSVERVGELVELISNF